jgi:predicted dehydrogenase/predicted transcriptional regulator
LDRIGVGIIGSGYWGRKLAAGYLDAERRGRVKLVKVYDNSVASLGALLIDHETSSIGEERLSLDINDIIKNPEISAVHVATPYQTHNAFARVALEAGKNVIVEKPISLSPSECHELIDLAGEKGLVIEESHHSRFNRALQVASEIISRGDFGSVLYVRVQWTNTNSVGDMDVLYDLGPGPIDILNLLLGTWPTEVSGIAGAYRGSTHNELVNIFAEYPDNVFVHIELNGLHPRKVREVLIVGSNATLDIDCSNQRIIQHSGSKMTEIPVTATDTVTSEIDHFLDRIIHGDFSVDPVAIQTVETLEAIRSSLWRKVPTINELEKPPEPSRNEMPNLETAVGLLEIVHKGANKTSIMNEGELNPDLIGRYFVMLEKIGLVDSQNRSNQEKAYGLTTKGLQFLIDYYESQRLGEITDNTRRVLQAVGLGAV